jgi:hypothetical protein
VVTKPILASFLFLLLFSAFACAECSKAKPEASNHAYKLELGKNVTSGQIDIPIYVEKNGASRYCTITAVVQGTPSQYSVSVTPMEIQHTGTYYGVYPITVSASGSADSQPEIVTIDIFDKDTGTKMASIPINVLVTADDTTQRQRVCTKENTTDCSAQELIWLDMQPTVIGQNMSDISLLLGIVAAFAFIVLAFFFLLPRK